VSWRELSQTKKQDSKARRDASRKRLVERVEDDAMFAACAYVANADSAPTAIEESYILDYLASASRGEGDYVRVTKTSIAAVTRNTAVSKLTSYRLSCRPSLTKRRRLIDSLVRLASCDSSINNSELEAVRVVADSLGFPLEKHSTLRQLLGLTREKRTRENITRRSKAQLKSSPPHQWCYDLLGCSEMDSDERVKRAYRLLAAKLHPDKYAKETDRPETALAHHRDFQRLQEAYAEVRRLRPSLR